MPSIINQYPDPLLRDDFSTFLPKNGVIDPLSLNDIFKNEESFLSKEDVKSDSASESESESAQEDMVDMYTVLQEFYEAPPEAGQIKQRAGFTSPPTIKHNPFPLHYAASKGDVAQINKLISTGLNINTEDPQSATPLVIATLFGKTAAVRALLKAGAIAFDTFYEGHSALHIALEKKQYQIARILVEEGHASPNQLNWHKINPTTAAFSQLEKAITALTLQKNSGALKNEISEIVRTLETFAQANQEHAHLSLNHPTYGCFQIPLALALKTTASSAPDSTTRDMILNLSTKISSVDLLEKSYVLAKNLLATFPTGKAYTMTKIKLSNGESLKILADGHYKQSTTPLATESLITFTASLNKPGVDPQKIELFNQIIPIFEKAVNFAKKAGDPSTAQEALASYQRGETVLLPSGWDKHFVDVILSKAQELLAYSNTGDRYALNEGGIMLYRLSNTESIDKHFMHKILTNKEKMNMEFYMLYEHGPILKLNTLKMPNQDFGNCTWESHRNAVKGILYIELLNKGLAAAQAEKIAHQYFTEWDHFHHHYMLEQYLTHSPILPAKALGDIYVEIQKKKTKGEFTLDDALDSKLLAKTLTSTTHLEGFKSWIKSLPKKQVEALKTDFTHHGIATDAIDAGNTWAKYNPIKFVADLFAPHAPGVHDAAHLHGVDHVALAHNPLIEHHHPEALAHF